MSSTLSTARKRNDLDIGLSRLAADGLWGMRALARLALLLLLGAGLPPGRAAEPCLAPESIWRTKAIRDPQIAPDGNAAVYVLEWQDPATDAAYSNLWQVSTNGGSPRALTAGKFHDSSPRWSPDGKQLAFISDRSGRAQIHVRSIDSGHQTVITEGPEDPSHLSWSPDGQSIAFLRFVPGGPEWKPPMPAAPEGATWAPPPKVVTRLRWTFDGQGILRPGGEQIFVTPSEGGAARQISSPPFHHTSYLFGPEITWLDSQTVLTTAVEGPDGWAVYSGGDIYAFSLSGGRPRQITDRRGHEALLRVSPGGNKIAFIGYEWKQQSYHVSKLHVIDRDGSHLRVLTGSWDRDVKSPLWSSDSRSLYFLSDDRGATNLHAADLAGTRAPLTRGAQRLSELSISPTGRAVALRSSSTRPDHMVAFAMDSPSKLHEIADPNRQLLAGCSLSAAEEVVYESFDGTPIQGWLLKPPDFDSSRKYPLLVSIHGGPHAMYGVNFQHELRMYAARGYLTFYANPRGSTGYGEAFGNTIQYRWPGDDIKDILLGVDHLIEAGQVDENRMAVVGGSGGGLMTAWIITQTDRFRAAVAFYPVTNWFTHIGSNDNGYYVGSVYRKGMPWEQPQDYIDHSPLFQVENVNTPTMIITGEDDWRTPIAQSDEFYRALKIRGIDTVLIRVPGEAHGIRKHPSHRVATDLHALSWLDRHVSESPGGTLDQGSP